MSWSAPNTRFCNSEPPPPKKRYLWSYHTDSPRSNHPTTRHIVSLSSLPWSPLVFPKPTCRDDPVFHTDHHPHIAHVQLNPQRAHPGGGGRLGAGHPLKPRHGGVDPGGEHARTVPGGGHCQNAGPVRVQRDVQRAPRAVPERYTAPGVGGIEMKQCSERTVAAQEQQSCKI